MTVRLAAALVALGAVAAAQAQRNPNVEQGKREFDASCATCHGIDAKGGGPMKPFLAREPTDLTTLARRYGGTFPRSMVADLIDGRGTSGPGVHGTREMPVWGAVFREQESGTGRGKPLSVEWPVRARILALVDYLASLQER